MPFTTCDIGGFADKPSPQLLTRWMEAGVFFPMMRAHSVLSEKPHFPWLFGSAAEAAMRKALDLRYQLIPYYYSLAHVAHETGVPPMRPMAMAFPNDPACADLTSQWMLGDGLMAAPILTPGSTRTVHLPSGTWFSLDGKSCWKGGRDIQVTAAFDEMPVFVLAGTILPLAPVLQHTSQLPGGPLEVRVYGTEGSFTLFEDDGYSTGYLHDQVRRTTFHWESSNRTLTWTQQKNYSGPNTFKKIRVVQAGDKQPAGPAVDLTPQGSLQLALGG